jgi:uncharacterized protein YndB with AHSA1/START domain
MDAKIGGAFRMSFRNLTTGQRHSFGGQYVELVPNERLRYTDTFEDPNLPGEIRVTVTLKSVSVGTEVNIAQEGLLEILPVEACYRHRAAASAPTASAPSGPARAPRPGGVM